MTNRIPELDKFFPPGGECAFCGFPDKRHRLWDAIVGFCKNSTHAEVAHMYDLPIEAVALVDEIKPYQDVPR